MSVAVGLSVMVLLVILHVAKERERDVVAIVSAAMDFFVIITGGISPMEFVMITGGD